MAKHHSILNLEVTSGSPSGDWGKIPLYTYGEFILRTDGVVYDLQSDWVVTVVGSPVEGRKVKGVIDLNIENLNGYSINIFGHNLILERLGSELSVELIYDEDLNPIVIFSDELSETDPVAMAAIGNREYTEENSITSGETITDSLDSLDIEKAPLLNPEFTENITVNNAININPDSYESPIGAGEIRWDILENLDKLEDDYETINHLLGLGLLYKIQNYSGDAISRGELLMQSGVLGAVHLLEGSKVDANIGAFADNILGISANTIVDGESGYITGFGLVRGIDTSAFNKGDKLWHDPSNPGGFTSTMPDAPNPKVFIGTVINNHPTKGSIFVKISYGKNTGELQDIKNFDPSTLPDKRILAWNSTNQRWEQENLADLIGISIDLSEGAIPYYTSEALADSPITSDGIDISISNNLNLSGSIVFDPITPITTIVSGELRWNQSEGTAELGMGLGGVSQQLGLELYYRIKNLSAVTINDGKLVMLDGTIGASGILKARLSDHLANTFPRAIMGVATMNVSNGNDGFITQFGLVRGIDTSMWEEEDILWYDPASSGGLTNVMPEAPNAKVVIAVVVTKHEHNGSVFVRPSYGLKLSEVHDVKNYNSVDLSEGTILSWSTANSRWQPMEAFYDSTGSSGSTGQALFSTGTGTRWGNIGDALTFTKTNVGAGTTILGQLPVSSGYGAYIDYVILTTSNSPIRVGTVYSVWNTTTTDYMDYHAPDIGGSANTIKVVTVILGSLVSFRAVVTGGLFNIKISIRLI